MQWYWRQSIIKSYAFSNPSWHPSWTTWNLAATNFANKTLIFSWFHWSSTPVHFWHQCNRNWWLPWTARPSQGMKRPRISAAIQLRSRPCLLALWFQRSSGCCLAIDEDPANSRRARWSRFKHKAYSSLYRLNMFPTKYSRDNIRNISIHANQGHYSWPLVTISWLY